MMLIYGDDRDNRSFPAATCLIIAACIISYIYCATHPGFVKLLALVPHDLPKHYFYPLITANFAHADIFHISLNMFVFWAFAKSVEDKIGSIPFFFLYLCCGITGMLLYSYMHQDSFLPALGASGAIYGIMGAYLAFFPKQNLKIVLWFLIIIRFHIPAFIIIIAYSVIEFLSIENEANGYIGHSIHIGGFLFGLISGLLYGDDADKKKKKSYV